MFDNRRSGGLEEGLRVHEMQIGRFKRKEEALLCPLFSDVILPSSPTVCTSLPEELQCGLELQRLIINCKT